jgi:peptidase E
MILILASDLSFLLKHGYSLTGIPKSEMRIGYVTTAAKGARDQTFFEKLKKDIRDNGYSFEEIDIEDKNQMRSKPSSKIKMSCTLKAVILFTC